MCGLSFSLVIFYNLGGPFLIKHKLGVSAVTTGHVSLFMGLGWMGGGFLKKALINKLFLPKLRNANFVQLAFIVVMFASSFYIYNLFTLAIFAFLFHYTAGFIFNNYFTYCILHWQISKIGRNCRWFNGRRCACFNIYYKLWRSCFIKTNITNLSRYQLFYNFLFGINNIVGNKD